MILIFLGAPGVGKGTQAKRLAKELSIPQISTGDIFRDIIRRETELGKKAKAFVESGKLVPDDLVIEIVKDRLQRDDCSNGFIFDGFPRTEIQAGKLDELFQNLGMKLDYAINFIADKDEIVKRLVNRRVCSDCSTIYNLLTNPPSKENICDKCSGSLYQRKDDKEEVIINRLDVYEKQTYPLIDYYSSKNSLKNIEASGTPEEVYAKLKEKI
jgi:adenylate kinase